MTRTTDEIESAAAMVGVGNRPQMRHPNCPHQQHRHCRHLHHRLAARPQQKRLEPISIGSQRVCKLPQVVPLLFLLCSSSSLPFHAIDASPLSQLPLLLSIAALLSDFLAAMCVK